MTALHRRLKQLRLERGWSQSYLANQLGLNKASVAKWEAGLSAPTAARAVELAKLFAVSMSELYGEAA